MKAVSHQYLLADDVDPDRFLDQLELPGQLQVSSVQDVERIYLDTFDWRLHVAGSCLVEERSANGIRTRWLRLEDSTLLAQQHASAPRFAADLPSSPLRKGLVPLLEMRALLPRVHLQVREMPARLLNGQGRTVLRLVVEQARAGVPGGPFNQFLPARVCLEPVKGDHKPLLLAVRQLQEVCRLMPAEPLLDSALHAVGRPPQDYSGKLNLSLQPEMAAGEAVRRIFQVLLRIMQQNLEGICADLDSEFLHDFRVAVRRTRSLLSQVKGVLPSHVLKHFRPELTWLGQITGPARDLDVYLLQFPAYRQSLAADMQADLQPLHDFLVKHRQLEQRKLARQLRSARCRQLLQDWQKFLETSVDGVTWPKRSTRPIGELANRRLWKAYHKVLHDGAAIDVDSAAISLHELRIDCKKLRYLMEFFASLYPGKVIRRQIKELKALQDHLGEFQDLAVQAEALRRFGQEMQFEFGNLPSETFMAIGVLIDVLYQRQARSRQEFALRFTRFASQANRKTCRTLFMASNAPQEENR